MKKLINSIKEEYKSKSKKVLTVYLILKVLTIICLIREIAGGDIKHIVTAIVTLILFLIPSILHRKFKIIFPDTLEITIYILIFSAEVLGEILGFYVHIKIFDLVLHLLSGFVMAGIGLSLIEVFKNKNKIKHYLNPKYLILFGIFFSMTTEVAWEIFEYSSDKLFKQDMQKDTIITEISSIVLNEKEDTKPKTVVVESLVVNGEDYIEKYGGYIDIGLNDTMKDLIAGLIGALLFSVIGYKYLKGKGKIASKFMIKKCN